MESPSGSKPSRVSPFKEGPGLKVGTVVLQGKASLTIAQINVKNGPKRVYDLRLAVSQVLSKPRPDIIALQDVPEGFPWLQFPGYHRSYCASRALTEEDRPGRRTKKAARTKKGGTKAKEPSEWQLDRVAFYVHESIPLFDWEVTYHTAKSNGLAATLCLNTASGLIRIHNVHNRNKELDMTQLFRYCEISSSDILLGDFNLHHPTWGGDNLPVVEKSAEELHGLSVSYNMSCLTPRGEVTYSRSDSVEKYSSTIDLIFAGVNIATRHKSCRVIGDLPGFQSDHRVVVTKLEMSPYREVKARYVWRLVKDKDFLAAVESALSGLGLPPLESASDIDDYLERFMGAITATLRQEVPIRRQAPRIWKPMHATHGKFASLQAKALDKMKGLPNNRFRRYWQYRKRKAQLMARRGDTTLWRRFIASNSEGAAKGRQRIFHWSRRSKVWAQPKPLPHMPSLFSADGTQHTTHEAKALLVSQTLWPNISDGQEAPEKLPMPDLPPDSASKLQISKELELGDLERLIKDLPEGKAEGPDQVGNEAFRLSLKVVAPFLHHFFQACLNLDYHPRAFRHALTVVLPKADKKSYDVPKSWRPVALLSCVGKMLEKIVANKIKELLLSNPDLCPLLQFGRPGKSTTHAMEYIVNWVHRSWQRPAGGVADHTSLLSLDISGAYDNVLREHLCQRLVEKGFPNWIVRIVWSFLSERSTVLIIPGYRSRKFWVNIGIPQGSPLSPILFILFAAPILESFDNYTLKTGKRAGEESSNTIEREAQKTCVFSVISYVDDTNFLVSSPSFEMNCAILTELHRHLMEWANAQGVKFGADKYALMHFLPRKPRGPEGEQPMPDIEGLDKKELVKETMRILGVIFDRHLKWDAHINSLKEKISKMLAYHTRISGSVWGPTLIQMRRLYISKMRSTIAYGSPAWYIPWRMEHNLGLTKGRLENLEALQNECLVKVAGAHRMTDRMVLRKELHIESMEHYLGRVGATYRMKNVGSEYMHAIEKAQYGQRKINRKTKSKSNYAHPYTILYAQDRKRLNTEVKAKFLLQDQEGGQLWEQTTQPSSIPRVAKLIKDYNGKRSMDESRKEWRRYVADKSQNREHVPAAYRGEWGPGCLQVYRHLSRAESTMLIQCRTRVIGLNSWLIKLNSDKKTYADSGLCPCNEDLHTIDHLFLKCPLLTKQRLELVARVKDFDLYKLLTCDAKAASQWAIRNFGLYQFAWPRQELLEAQSTTPRP